MRVWINKAVDNSRKTDKNIFNKGNEKINVEREEL